MRFARNGEVIAMPRSAHAALEAEGFRLGEPWQPRYQGARGTPFDGPVYIRQAEDSLVAIIGRWIAEGRAPRMNEVAVLQVYFWPRSPSLAPQQLLEMHFASVRELIDHLTPWF